MRRSGEQNNKSLLKINNDGDHVRYNGTMAAEHSKFYVRFRRFLVFGRRVMMHITTILLSLIGSAVLLIPTWLRPLLSPVAQKTLDRYDAVLPESAYSHLAVAVLIGGFILACFFAWEEERQESEELR